MLGAFEGSEWGRRFPYNVENALVIVRLAIIHRFGE